MYLPCWLNSYSMLRALIKQPSYITCKITDTIPSTLVRPPFRKVPWLGKTAKSLFNISFPFLFFSFCKKAKLQARMKPTALCSAIDKENLIESLLDFATLYIQLLLWLCTLSPTVLMSISWLLCHIAVTVTWLWCDFGHTFFVTLWLLCDISHAPP